MVFQIFSPCTKPFRLSRNWMLKAATFEVFGMEFHVLPPSEDEYRPLLSLVMIPLFGSLNQTSSVVDEATSIFIQALRVSGVSTVFEPVFGAALFFLQDPAMMRINEKN